MGRYMDTDSAKFIRVRCVGCEGRLRVPEGASHIRCDTCNTAHAVPSHSSIENLQHRLLNNNDQNTRGTAADLLNNDQNTRGTATDPGEFNVIGNTSHCWYVRCSGCTRRTVVPPGEGEAHCTSCNDTYPIVDRRPPCPPSIVRCPGCQTCIRMPEGAFQFRCECCSMTLARPRADGGPAADARHLVRCSQCRDLLRPPSRARMFRCPCGAFLSRPRASSVSEESESRSAFRAFRSDPGAWKAGDPNAQGALGRTDYERAVLPDVHLAPPPAYAPPLYDHESRQEAEGGVLRRTESL